MISRSTWKVAGIAGTVALAVVLVTPQSSTASPPRPVTSTDTGTIVTDTFQSDSESLTFRDVPGVDGRPYLGNITATCSFGSSDESNSLNTTTVSVQSQTPSGPSPFLTTFQERSTNRVVTVVTGPFAAYDGVGAGSTYSLNCTPGAGNSFGQAFGQAWIQVVP